MKRTMVVRQMLGEWHKMAAQNIAPLITKCFGCINPIINGKATIVKVRPDFCHPSYWQTTDKGYTYGYLDKKGEFGYLLLCKKCDANENYGSPLGEGYIGCDDCGSTFSDDDLSMGIYEKSGDTLCPHCAKEYVRKNIEEFLNSGLPDFKKRLPSFNLGGLDLDKVPNLIVAPEDTQGWASSLGDSRDIGHGTYREAIKAVVERGHKWLVVVAATTNICSTAVTVYEYLGRAA